MSAVRVCDTIRVTHIRFDCQPLDDESRHLHPFRLFSCALCPALPHGAEEPGGFIHLRKAGPTSGGCGVLGVTLVIIEVGEPLS